MPPVGAQPRRRPSQRVAQERPRIAQIVVLVDVPGAHGCGELGKAGSEPVVERGPLQLPGHVVVAATAGELQWASLHDRLAPRLAEVAATMRPWDVYEYDDLRDPWPLLRHALGRAAPRLSPYRGHVSK